MRTLALLRWGVLAAAFVAVPIAAAVATFRGGASDDAGTSVLWADEFDGPAGQAPDRAKWWREAGCHVNEASDSCDSPSNVALDGRGHLAITITKGPCPSGTGNYCTGRVLTFMPRAPMPPTRTLYDFSAGTRIEASIRMPSGYGVGGSLWHLNTASPGGGGRFELDTQESAGAIPSAVRCSENGGGTTSTERVDISTWVSDGFHLYWIDLFQDHYVMGVDDRTCRSSPLPGNHRQDRWGILLSTEVGACHSSWWNCPHESTPFPESMLVNYVRAMTVLAH